MGREAGKRRTRELYYIEREIKRKEEEHNKRIGVIKSMREKKRIYVYT